MSEPVVVEYTPRQRRAALWAACLGNVVEQYDWLVYATFAVYFAPQMFPESSAVSALLGAAAIFAVGFGFRPLGGWLLGRVADRYGRRTSLLLSTVAITVGTLVIAVAPTYAQVGVAASLLVLLGRIVQGIAYGGEYGAIATTLREIAPARRRGLYSSTFFVSTVLGQVLGFAVLLVLKGLLAPAAMAQYGWRIGFAVAVLGSVAVAVLRRGMTETPAFRTAVRDRVDRGALRTLFGGYSARVVLAMAIAAGGTVYFYTFTVYYQQFAVNSFRFDVGTASLVTMIALVVFGAAQPLCGMLGDRWGALTMFAIGAGGCAFVPVPAYLLLEAYPTTTVLAGVAVVAVLPLAVLASVMQTALASLFEPHVRAVGIGIGYSVAVAAFGGTASFVALSLRAAGVEIGYFWYVTMFSVLGLVASLAARRVGTTSVGDDARTIAGKRA